MPSPIADIPRPLSIMHPDQPLRLHTRAFTHAKGLHRAIMDHPDHFTDAGERTAERYADIEDMIREIEDPDPDIHRLTMLVHETPVGSLDYTTKADVYHPGLAWWVGRRYKGHRYAVQAILLFAGYAFENTDILSLVAEIRPANTASIRTAEIAGFGRIGRAGEFERYQLPRFAWKERRQS